MRAQASPPQNSPPTLTPSVRPRMPWRVAQVQALPDFRLRVQFVDGLEGIVDMAALVRSTTAGVFAALSNPTLFQQVAVEYGAVTWPGDIDLAPDAMYEAIKSAGEWRLT